MNEVSKKSAESVETGKVEVPRQSGLFKKLFTKIDTAMKQKAEAQAKSSCCGSDDSSGKGGKCC